MSRINGGGSVEGKMRWEMKNEVVTMSRSEGKVLV